MKNRPATLLVVLFLAAFEAQAGAVAVGDTLVIEQPDRVLIETRDTMQRLVVSGAKDAPYFLYTQRIAIADTSAVRRKMSNLKDFNKISVSRKDGKPSRLDLSLHLYGGLGTMAGAPSGYSFWPSFEMGVGFTLDCRPGGRRNVWSVGLMGNWRTYHVAHDRYWAPDADGQLTAFPFADGQTKTGSRLSSASLQIPLLYTHRFDERGRWALTVGTMLNLNSAQLSRDYDYEGEHYDVSSHHVGQHPFSADVVAMLKVPSLPAIYCKYSPTAFFREGRGPKIHQLSFGLFL